MTLKRDPLGWVCIFLFFCSVSHQPSLKLSLFGRCFSTHLTNVKLSLGRISDIRSNKKTWLTNERSHSPSTRIGCDLGWVSPIPSWPYSLLPHAHKIPSSDSAKLWNAPTAIVLTCSSPCTRTGVDIFLLKKRLGQQLEDRATHA
jgi:hypothetical protein